VAQGEQEGWVQKPSVVGRREKPKGRRPGICFAHGPVISGLRESGEPCDLIRFNCWEGGRWGQRIEISRVFCNQTQPEGGVGLRAAPKGPWWAGVQRGRQIHPMQKNRCRAGEAGKSFVPGQWEFGHAWAPAGSLRPILLGRWADVFFTKGDMPRAALLGEFAARRIASRGKAMAFMPDYGPHDARPDPAPLLRSRSSTTDTWRTTGPEQTTPHKRVRIVSSPEISDP